MIYLVDGSNVLGRAGADRESVDDKRVLLRAAAAFARRERLHLVLYFDVGRDHDDVALSGRVNRRGVTTLAPGTFLSRLDPPPEEGLPQEDWERYFSDPQNRETF